MIRILFLLLLTPVLLIAQPAKKLKGKERKLIEAGNPNEVMRILVIGNRKDSLFLRKEARKVNLEKDKDLIVYFSKRLKATVQNPKNLGVGIAAPQVGLQRRLIYVQRFDKEGEPFEFYINPEIKSYSDSTQVGKEGCLSIPNRTEEVIRSREVVIEYVDWDGKKHIESVSGFTSVIFQHEIDHLDGILYIDHLEKHTSQKD
jgi:peptide deformylase